MTPDPLPPEADRVRPWRSSALGWAVAALALAVGVPPFLCLPPWNDVTLHDMAVRSMLRGGVHYRDVFDTNLPGIDWAMAAVRLAFGWSYEALRAVDLLVIAAEVALLIWWVRRAGGEGYTVAWLAAAVALWYPFTSEFNHVQRDPWLLLPALVAARLRLLRVERGADRRRSILEGLAWGTAVWVKPHVMLPALALWAVSVVLVRRREPWRAVFSDLGGLLLGGVLAGAAGVAWLVGTGAWHEFLDVFLNWNPGYLSNVLLGVPDRFDYTFTVFRPWSLLHAAAFPLALLALWKARAPGGSVSEARALLAAMYLAWCFQGIVFQKGFDYVQVPMLLLGMAVVASHRWAFGFAYLVWFAVLGVLLNFTALAPPGQKPAPGVPVLQLELHPATDPRVLKLWPRCWREGGSAELRDKLATYTDVFCGTHWEQLGAVAEYLRGVRPALGPRELNCWHDSTHPLYLMLDLDPATRYMHYGTAFDIPGKRELIARAVADSPQRRVVADLARMTWYSEQQYEPGADGPLSLPAWFPASQRTRFPWDQKMVFRSGRYVVYEVVRRPNPDDIDIPDWNRLDELK